MIYLCKERRVKIRTWYGMGGTVIIILVIYNLTYAHRMDYRPSLAELEKFMQSPCSATAPPSG
jgi:hypothetical protein